jgi:hypothetical protein
MYTKTKKPRNHKRGCENRRDYLDPTCPLCSIRIEQGFKQRRSRYYDRDFRSETFHRLEHAEDILHLLDRFDSGV